MRPAAASKGGLYRAYDDADNDEDNVPTHVGHPLEETALVAPISSIPPRVAPSFFPPDDPRARAIPPGISGEYPAVRLETMVQAPIETIPPSDKTFNIRVREQQKLQAQGQRLGGNDSGFGFGWMLGLAFMSACTVFVWLWFVARLFVR